jgi:hypothetical protein
MCNERNIKNEYYLNDNIQIQGPISDFNLLINGNLILEHCSNFSFIPGKLFTVKNSSIVYVFSTKVMNIKGKFTLEELANFNISSPKIFTKVIVEDTAYIIDFNCQITFNDCKKCY